MVSPPSSNSPTPQPVRQLPEAALQVEEQGVAVAFHADGDGVVGGVSGLRPVFVLAAVAVVAAVGGIQPARYPLRGGV